MKLVAACAFGLEASVKWELTQLGYAAIGAGAGRVHFEGDWQDVARANLWLRTADRILIEVVRFESPDFEALFETIKALDWKAWMPRDARFPVTARTRHSQLTSLPAIQRSAKKAIVESMMAAHATTTLPEDGPEFRIDVALLNDEAAITIDTTGASLHKRGYRRSYGMAPIKETLAAALVMLSVWSPGRPFLDPFCGSGTIAIEAALIARNRAPGMGREFAWQHWAQGSEFKIDELLADSEQSNDGLDEPLQIMALDTDSEVLRFARINAEKAGVAEDIHFQQKSFEDLRSKRQYGCLITNPPYGERLGEAKKLLALYESFPSVLQRLPTWSHFVLTAFRGFEKVLQKKADRRRKLYNGRIECTYYQYLGPKPPANFRQSVANGSVGNDSSVESDSDELIESNPTIEASAQSDVGGTAVASVADSTGNDSSHLAHEDLASENADSLPSDVSKDSEVKASQPSKVSAPVFGGLQEKDHHQAELFESRLKKRGRHLRKWPTKRGIGCYRLYERDIPELPFVVDRYEDRFHVTEYERPHERDAGRHAAWLELMKKTVAKTFEVPIQHVFMKTRLRQKGNLQHEKQGDTSNRVEVQEGGLKFLVNLADYVDTGLFLDHRQTRAMVMSESAGKDFLNLFAYTGAFSVYAAAGGAKSTATVDWSNTYLNWARDNMQLNGFSELEHAFIREDSLKFLENLPREKKFDLVVVDPPTFSNSSRTEKVWDVQACYAELLERLASHVTHSGVVYFSTNFRKFKFDPELVANFDCREISSQTVPEDFRNRKIHRCWKLTRK